MRSAPSAAPEKSPFVEYDRLLARGIAVVRELETTMKRWNRIAGAESLDIKARDRLAAERLALKSEMKALIQTRAGILRQARRLETVEDAFPRVRGETGETAPAVQEVAAILGAPDAAGASPQPAPAAPPLTEDDWRAYEQARAALAERYGYRVDPSTDDDGFFSLIRGQMRIDMVQSPFPRTPSITGNGRIGALIVAAGEGEDRPVAFEFYRDSFDRPTTDVAVWREIDRVVAIFG